MPRSRPRLPARLGTALAAAIVAASVALVVVNPRLGPEAERPAPGGPVPAELMWLVMISCMQGSNVNGLQLAELDGGGVLRAQAIDDRGRIDAVSTDDVNRCFADHPIEPGAAIAPGWQPTPGEALAMHDLALGRIGPCLAGHGFPPRPRGTEDFLNGDWSPYPDSTTPERIPDVVAAYRICGSPAAPFRTEAAASSFG